jgi:hypothetical protein
VRDARRYDDQSDVVFGDDVKNSRGAVLDPKPLDAREPGLFRFLLGDTTILTPDVGPLSSKNPLETATSLNDELADDESKTEAMR